MKTRTFRLERQSAAPTGHHDSGALLMSAGQPIAPGATLEETIAHARRLAVVSRKFADSRTNLTEKQSAELNHAGDVKRVQLLEAWANLSQAAQTDALTAANTVPDLLFHDAQAGDEAAAARLVALAHHVTVLVSRLASEGNHVATAGMVDLTESLTRNLNFAANEHPERLAGFADYRFEWPVMGSIRSKQDKDLNDFLEMLGLAARWRRINRVGKKWKHGPAQQIVLALVDQVLLARPLFSIRHFPDLRGLASRLHEQADAQAKYVWDRLTPSTQHAIEGYLLGAVPAEKTAIDVFQDVRMIIHGPPITWATRPLLSHPGGFAYGVHLPAPNWLALAKAFPGLILPPETSDVEWLAEATLEHLNHHHADKWWDAIKRRFATQHTEPGIVPQFRSLVTARSHQQNLHSRILQKLEEAFDAIVGVRQKDPRHAHK